ncbi:alpha/beta hydrolase [Halomonas sp. ISL-60]|uniref:alpha/beta fold hydrolase n=1 Tax=Halomonas sp. ISL-56 TaxID=2819149 RepID=UPI001BE7E8AB|nr:alpha/beta hydrolase [Halomonas sp. ISL-60]MBT2801575.1 alpha/beta hydrolase [Halomonas sp. ISL-56]
MSKFYRAFFTLMAASLLLAFSLTAPAETIQYEVASTDGISIAVQESGDPDGQPIVFIHGYLGSHLNWQPQVNSELLQKYRLITYDLRGHGLSGKPEEATTYSDGRRWADDLAAVIQATNARQPILVGWSLGGAVISNYLNYYDDRDISGAVYVDGVVELNAELITAHPEIYQDMVSENLKTNLEATRAFLRLCFAQQPESATFQLLLANAALASWDMKENVLSMSVSLAGLGRINKPILMLYGEKDALVQVDASINRAKEVNPNVETLIYENSGHAPFIEESARFNQDLATFIEDMLH